jgi:hypothetical protein
MRLRVRRGYRIAVGQQYGVCPHLPGQSPRPGCALIGSAWVTVVRVRIDSGGSHFVVEAVRDPIETDTPSLAE